MTARRAFASLALLTLILVGLTIAVRALPRPEPQPVSPVEVDATPTMTAGVAGDRGGHMIRAGGDLVLLAASR